MKARRMCSRMLFSHWWGAGGKYSELAVALTWPTQLPRQGASSRRSRRDLCSSWAQPTRKCRPVSTKCGEARDEKLNPQPFGSAETLNPII